MNTFAAVGKKVDEHIEEFTRKVGEAVDGMRESLKSADRRGFERALKLAANEARSGVNHDPSDRISAAILKIPYTPSE